MIRICKECGKEFETKSSRRMFCYDDHYRVCEGCGELFLVPSNKLSSPLHTCSEECRRAAIGKHTLDNRPQYTCVCKYCGNTFISYDKDACVCPAPVHTFTCTVCGCEYDIHDIRKVTYRATCSERCRKQLRESTTFARFGVKNIFQDPTVRQAYREQMIERYGVDNPLKSAAVREANKQVLLERYGVDHPSKSAEIQQRSIATCMERYGVPYVFQDPNFQEAAKATNLQRYGAENVSKSATIVAKLVNDPSKVHNWETFHANPKDFIESHFPTRKPTYAELAELCGMRDSSIGQILLASGLRDMVQTSYSHMEDELVRYLEEILPPGSEIVRNTRRVITPLEIDIYLPDYKFGIECNPTCTHNSSTCVYAAGDEPKSPSYHKRKTDLCESKGVFLFHIFGHEWTWKRDIIKSMIANLLGCNLTKVYARKTQVVKLSSSECFQFLEANHRQGGVHTAHRYGLLHNNKLVSVMTFSKMRNTIGTDGTDLSDCYELVRFCSLCGYTVVGAASKLFRQFIKDVAPERIRSFSDRSHTRGALYSTLGFMHKRTSDPGYVWVDTKSDKAYSRYNAQKQNICQFLHDDCIDLTQSEKSIMESHGYVQVFDSGTIMWEWTALEKGDVIC